MKMCFKFHQNRPINEEFDFWEGRILSVGPRGARFQKLQNASYKTVFSTHSKNFSILAELESVKKIWETE